jgi:F-type H+-transporting ATPase subunit a
MNTAYAATEGGVSIHLASPVLGHFFGIPLTSTLVTVWLTMVLLLIFAYIWSSRLKMIPGKIQVCIEALFGTAYDHMATTLESRENARKFFPLIMTIFIFILSLNWIGLIPGVSSIGIYGESHGKHELIPFLYPANTDLNITIGLSIAVFLAIELAGIFMLGFFKYAGKFINLSSPLNFFIGIIELVSEIARLISFSFRLFGNIFAGKTLLVLAVFFVPFVLPVPILAFELCVGIIQAFIFAVLTLIFIKLAIQKPEH